MSVLISSVWNDTNNRLIISKHIQKRKHFCIISAPIYLTYLFYFQYGINIYDIFIKQNYIKEFSLAAVLHFIIFFKNFSFVCYDENDSFSLPKTFINTMLCKISVFFSHMLPNVMFLICGENFSMLFVGGGILDHHFFLYNMLTELCWCLKHDLQLFQNCDTWKISVNMHFLSVNGSIFSILPSTIFLVIIHPISNPLAILLTNMIKCLLILSRLTLNNNQSINLINIYLLPCQLSLFCWYLFPCHVSLFCWYLFPCHVSFCWYDP